MFRLCRKPTTLMFVKWIHEHYPNGFDMHQGELSREMGMEYLTPTQVRYSINSLIELGYADVEDGWRPKVSMTSEQLALLADDFKAFQKFFGRPEDQAD